MSPLEIARARLASQQISPARSRKPAELVASLGAMQAQDYAGALWAVGLRLPGEPEHATELSIEDAIARRTVIRTWPMRGTLHLVAADDIRWMLELLTPRIIAGTASRMQRLELNEKIFERCRKLFLKALAGDRQLTREAMLDLLEKEKISTASMRGYHILWRLAQEGTICFAGRSGKQQKFALLHEWAPKAKSRERMMALGELALRYFTGHGPATLQDFVWWSGLKVSDARAGLERVAEKLSHHKVEKTMSWMSRELPKLDGLHTAHLLPGFDEYLLGYRDRNAVLDAKHARKIVPGSNGVFLNTLVLDGRVVGTWKREVKRSGLVIIASPFGSLKKPDKAAFDPAVQRYGRFMDLPVEIRWGAK